MSKPSLQIFEMALNKAGCMPEESYMIGDRRDKDIEPVTMLLMNTIWVRQGSFSYGNPKLLQYRLGVIVDSLEEILNCL